MYQIKTLPVYSKLSKSDNLPAAIKSRLPEDWRLSEHQLETYQALRNNRYEVVINTAMTGDGKSLAAYMPALVHGDPLLALYPTNELARDQELQLPDMLAQWHAKLDYKRISASLLDEMIAAGQASRKSTALEQLADNNELILTNPDIFHYLAQFFYTQKGDAPDRLFGRKIVDNFDLFVFDEFHIFEAPQVIAVVNALLLVREVSRIQGQRKRFLFLSATPGDLLPDDLLMNYLQKAGFDVYLVNTNSRYQHTRHTPDAKLWRPIIRETDIHFWVQGIEEWIEDHLDDTLLAFFRSERPSAKGAIIVNSVASAYRLATRLKPILKAEGLTVELNTGLTSEALKKASRESDLLIGTSTVDVGVDFRINFLLFESRDAATFLQRLGRLGRHADDGQGHSFTTFHAHALIPNFVQERLFPGRLTDRNEYSREELATAIREAYPTPTQFKDYARHWGRIQCAHVYSSLSQAPVRDTYTQTRENLKSLYWQTFSINVFQAIKDTRAWRKECQPLLEEAQSFRGGSPLQCGVIDETENGRNQVKRYSLLTLAANANLNWLGRDEFNVIARQLYDNHLPFPTDDLAGWFRFHGFNDKWRPVIIKIDHPVGEWSSDKLGTPQVLNRIRLDMDGADWLNALNRHLVQRNFVVTLCLTPPSELRYKLYLPPLFQLYEFHSPLDGSSGTVAFARQALLLHVALLNGRVDCGGGAILL
jgi:CRISPR-associated endonuclease/helicase Cas3